MGNVKICGSKNGTYAVVSVDKVDGHTVAVRFDNECLAGDYYNKVAWYKGATHKVVEFYGTPLEREI